MLVITDRIPQQVGVIAHKRWFFSQVYVYWFDVQMKVRECVAELGSCMSRLDVIVEDVEFAAETGKRVLRIAFGWCP